MRSFIRLGFVLAALVLAGCKPAQVTLGLDPAFYPSAIAHDPVNDRFFIGSHASGAIAIVRRDGSVAASVRPEQATRPVVQMGYEPRVRRLWVLTPETVEAVDVAALPVRRTVVAEAAPGGRLSDLVIDGAGRAFVLEATAGTIISVDASRQRSRVLAHLPFGEGDGSLMLLPDGATLVVARGGGLWRVDARSGEVEPVALGAPLTDVSQLVVLATDATAHHVAAFRGLANEVVTLHLSPDARRAVADSGTRMRFDTPLHGTFDGREVVVLLGRIRHHPSFGGDGRPNLPPRFATYFPAGATGPRLAEAPPATGRALVR
jgi:hypothetical protein